MTPINKEEGTLDEILNVLVNNWQSNKSVEDSVRVFNKAKAALKLYCDKQVLLGRIDELERLVKHHNTKSMARITNCSVVNNIAVTRLAELKSLTEGSE